MFARRASWDLTPNELARRVEARRASGLPLLDLSDANPTRVGLRAPAAALRAALEAVARDPRAARYEPDPRGDARAREAVAAWHCGCGAQVAAEHVVLTAGTSEGYAHVFRLLGDPGDVVHVPSPGYGLFEHLAALEGLAAERYPLLPPEPGGARWRLDLEALAASVGPRSRAVLLIHPHNPTGSFVDPADLAALRALARARGVALVSDEVFAGSAAAPGAPPGALAGAEDGPLHVVLSGVSKLLALPQCKLAWLAVGGPEWLRDEAVARLEFIADAFLSVSPLLAGALPALFEARPAIERELEERLRANRAALAAALAGTPRAALLPAEAGWAAIVRYGAAGRGLAEDALVLALLDEEGVLVQPGFLFDLEPPEADTESGHLVLSLLAEPARFAAGAAAVARVLAGA